MKQGASNRNLGGNEETQVTALICGKAEAGPLDWWAGWLVFYPFPLCRTYSIYLKSRGDFCVPAWLKFSCDSHTKNKTKVRHILLHCLHFPHSPVFLENQELAAQSIGCPPVFLVCFGSRVRVQLQWIGAICNGKGTTWYLKQAASWKGACSGNADRWCQQINY